MPPPASGFPADPREIAWDLLQELQRRPHPLLRPGGTSGDTSALPWTVTEVLHEAVVVHHLLDMAGVPQGYGMDTRDIASRTLVAIIGLGALRERLDRISGWHARESGPGGTVGDSCDECGRRWPCPTRQMADGTRDDEAEGSPS